jgi:small subunit ribosomal protein S17
MTKRIFQGRVVSDKADKTVIVEVERKYRHVLYQKTMKEYKRYSAHDENNKCKENDIVKIEESRPISKTKKWIVKFD